MIVLAGVGIHGLVGPLLATSQRTPRAATVLQAVELASSTAQAFVGLKSPLLDSGGRDSLATLRASRGWCLDDAQLGELRRQKNAFQLAMSYLDPADQAHVLLAIEVTFQARTAAGKVDKLRHALAVARVLTSINASAKAIEAAMLAGMCDDTDISLKDLEAVLGRDAATSSWQVGEDVSKVWKLSELLEAGGPGSERVGKILDGLADDDEASRPEEGPQDELQSALETNLKRTDVRAAPPPLCFHVTPSTLPSPLSPSGARRPPLSPRAMCRLSQLDEAVQLERQCQILLAGCDVSVSMVVALASRLVSMRELQAALAGQPVCAHLSCRPRSALKYRSAESHYPAPCPTHPAPASHA